MSPTPSLGSRLGGAAKLWGGVLAGVVPGAVLVCMCVCGGVVCVWGGGKDAPAVGVGRRGSNSTLPPL